MKTHFTLELANRMLPLVSRIVRDILDQYREWQRSVEAFEVATALDRGSVASAESVKLQKRTQELAADIQSCLRELADLGVEFKGFELGLVDFPGEVEGRTIHWCWKYGEDAVRYWHEIDQGFAGRQPTEALFTGVRPVGLPH